MSDTLNLPSLAVFQLPANPRADTAPVAPERLGGLPAAGGTIISFADLIKAVSASDADPSLDINVRPDSPEAPIDLSVTISNPSPLITVGSPLQPENPLMARLLARLAGDVAGSSPTEKDDLATDAGVASPAVQGLLAPDLPPGTIPPTLPANPVIANPNTAATKPEVSHAAVAVPPAPTFGVPEATQRELPAASAVPGQAPAQGAEPAERSAPFAVSAAKSADAGKAGALNPNQVGVGEFRPVFERVSDAAGNIPVQGAQPQASTQSFAVETPQLRMTTPFAQAGWVQEVDQNLHWMVGNTRQQADLVLNPPELGRIEVTLVIQGDEVSASFASPHQAVREAIEESLVRLRESLSDSGINLGQTHVGRDSSRDAPFMKAEGDGQQGRGARQEGTMPIGTPLTQGSAFQSRGRGMVDVFA